MSVSSIGIVICNYNKSSYVVNCIQSVLESDIDNFDIYVVDNASTDDSVEQIEKNFGDKVTLLINKENLGGSGGFNTGIRKVLEGGYPYIMCLDNDALVDEEAISALFSCMEEHPEIGMLGSRVYHMEEPDYVQQFGLNIDFDNYIVDTLYANAYEDGTIPELLYCDTVATCSVMVRTEAVRKAGIMPEDNFIYWDDMEWGYRIGLAGYKVAAYGKSKALHIKGAANRNNAVFTNYYNMRNRIHFFAKYIQESQLEDFTEYMLDSVFDTIYESMYRDEHCSAMAVRYALEDAMHGVRGRADAYKMINEDEVYDGMESVFTGQKTFSIAHNDNQWLEENVREYIQINYPNIYEVDYGKADVNVVLCDYIMNIREFCPRNVYIDDYYNVLSDENQWEIISNYSYSKALFLYMNRSVFLENIRKINSEFKM